MEEDEGLRLGRRLAAFRTRRGIEQKDLAQAIGISPKHLSQVENGHQSLLSLRVRTLRLIADYFKISMDRLCERDTSADTEDDSEPAAVEAA